MGGSKSMSRSICRTEQCSAMDQMEPLQMTDAELAAWEAERQARKDREKADFFKQAEKLQRMWE
jgi:hypothetical protein